MERREYGPRDFEHLGRTVAAQLAAKVIAENTDVLGALLGFNVAHDQENGNARVPFSLTLRLGRYEMSMVEQVVREMCAAAGLNL